MTALPPQSARPPVPPRVWAGCIALATLICYLPAIGGAFLWDDPDYVANNPTLRSVHGLWQIWTQPSASPQYYPLVFSSFWMEYHLWGLHTFGYHAVNLLLHIGSALLIWKIANDLRIPGGWLAAAIFALHPVNVESVAWISERKNALSTVFYLLAMRTYLREFTWRRWGIALLCFIAALLSKSVTAPWPAAMLVIFWWRNGRVRFIDALRLVPFFLLAIGSGAFTTYVEHAYVGASGAQIQELNFTIAERFLIAGRAVWFYAGKLVLPWPLSFIYPRWQLDPHVWWQWIFPALAMLSCIAAAAVAARTRLVPSPPYPGERVSVRGSTAHAKHSLRPTTLQPHPNLLPEGEGTIARGWARGSLAAVLLFIGTLFPALGFINVYPMRYSFVADHFAYLALPALIVPIACCLVQWFRASAVFVLPLAILTCLRAFAFASPLALWSDTYAKNLESWMVCTQLANALNTQHQPQPAGDLFLRAYELAPQMWETQTNAAIVFASRGQIDRGLSLLDSSQMLNPQFAITYFNRGIILENTGDSANAIKNYRRAIELAGEFPAAQQRLSAVQARAASTQHSGDAARQ